VEGAGGGGVEGADIALVLYEVTLCRVAMWYEEKLDLPPQLKRMPGTIHRISFNQLLQVGKVARAIYLHRRKRRSVCVGVCAGVHQRVRMCMRALHVRGREGGG
jgi:hypothetical protein